MRFRNNDPRWIVADRDLTATDGTPVEEGEEYLYYQLTGTIVAGDKADRAWREFLSAKGDEEGIPFAM